MAKKRWAQSKLRMTRQHEWKSKPGYNIFVANAGEVRFDFPEDWAFNPGESSLEFRDKEKPDDDCLLQVSIMHLNPEIDWSSLPLAQIFADLTRDDPRGDIDYGEVQYEKRADCELAWRDGRWHDPSEDRDAVARACLARGGTVLPFITMDFWLDDHDRFSPVWDEVLRSLRLGDMVKDPRTGRVTRLDTRHN